MGANKCNMTRTLNKKERHTVASKYFGNVFINRQMNKQEYFTQQRSNFPGKGWLVKKSGKSQIVKE